MNKVMFEVMRYFGLNHRPSSGEKWKLIELRVTLTLESQIKIVFIFSIDFLKIII